MCNLYNLAHGKLFNLLLLESLVSFLFVCLIVLVLILGFINIIIIYSGNVNFYHVDLPTILSTILSTI